MNDKTAIYTEEMLPLVHRLYTIATEHAIPLIVVVQVSGSGQKITVNIPESAHEEMKDCAKWWLQGVEESQRAKPDEAPSWHRD